ncbi:MAG: tRNA-specific adenosine deaminase, partial [Candidatus Schekmanbacteria bacterium RIFCSPHIGHO2_02_FULL_38_11]
EEARIAYREEEVPIGAAVVYRDEVIARDHNRIEQLQDPTAHAEMLVLKKTAERLKSWRLSEAFIYVTVEPCPMCVGAMHLARISGLIFGAKDEKKGAAGSLYNIAEDKRLNHRIPVFSGIMEEECRKIIEKFFIERRRK